MSVSRWLPRLLVVALIALSGWLLRETLLLSEQVGEQEVRAVAAERELAQLRAARTGSQGGEVDAPAGPDATPAPGSVAGTGAGPDDAAPAAVDAETHAQLRLELHTTQQRLEAVSALLEQRNEELRRRAEQNKEWRKPMPQGVRSCLATLHTCLRREGFYEQRFLHAVALDDEGLHDVEMLQTGADGLSVVFVAAARMTATLDRANSALELRFFDGIRAVDGAREPIDEDGWPLRFDGIDGPMFENMLPFLVVGEGEYPPPPPEPERDPTTLSSDSRLRWQDRLGRLLERAELARHWRVTSLRGLEDAVFLDVQLVGTDDNKLVQASYSCRRVAVEVDEASGVVSLLLRDGVLRQPVGNSTITAEGYRMLLPGVTPSEAIDAMLGMIVKR